MTLKPQVWDREVDHQIKQKAPNVRQGQTQGFDKMLFQLQGDESPEKYILWKEDFKKKIVLKKPDYNAVFMAFVDLTAKAASMVIHEVFTELNISETEDVKVKYTKQFTDGTLKRVTEPYLVNSISFTDAEARIHQEVGEFVRGEFMVTSISKTDFADIFHYDDAEVWYKCKVAYVSEDAESGKEKKINKVYNWFTGTRL